jgi:hypothetical protein
MESQAEPAVPVLPPPPSHHPSQAAPYHPPPVYPPPGYSRTGPTDGLGLTSLALGILGIVLALPMGLPGLVLGPLAYFIGKGAVTRIDASGGAIGGRGIARSGSIIGVIATAIGALVTLAWFVLLLVVISAPAPTG